MSVRPLRNATLSSWMSSLHGCSRFSGNGITIYISACIINFLDVEDFQYADDISFCGYTHFDTHFF